MCLFSRSCSCYIKTGTVFYVTIVLPLCLTTIASLIIFVVVEYHLIKQFAKRRQSGRSQIRRLIRASVSLAVILGLTWTIGFFLLIDPHPALQWIFTISSAPQGFFIFMFQTASSRILQEQVGESVRKTCQDFKTRTSMQSTNGVSVDDVIRSNGSKETVCTAVSGDGRSSFLTSVEEDCGVKTNGSQPT